jgi:lipoprotein-anchoring transpeptidase ErfK/SrfK
MKIPNSLLALSVAVFLASCNNSTTTNTTVAADGTSPAKKTETPAPQPEIKPMEVRYTYFLFKDSGRSRMRNFSAEQKDIIYSLNRVDATNIPNIDTLVIPDKFPADRREISPFPQSVAALKDVNKIILFSYPIQAFAVYANGVLDKWGPTSMGSKVHKTPTGLFFTNWKSEETVSTVDDEWILKWNFNIANKDGVGFHQYALPGKPASHSCLRLLEKDAMWLYEFADQWKLAPDEQTVEVKGTPTLVYGDYPFGGRRPWLNLLNDPKANDVSEQEITSLVQPHIAEIMEVQKQRAALPAETPKDATAQK